MRSSIDLDRTLQAKRLWKGGVGTCPRDMSVSPGEGEATAKGSSKRQKCPSKHAGCGQERGQ